MNSGEQDKRHPTLLDMKIDCNIIFWLPASPHEPSQLFCLVGLLVRLLGDHLRTEAIYHCASRISVKNKILYIKIP